MRVPILLLCPALVFNAVHGENLTPADREMLLDKLEKIRATADSTADARYRLAINAYRNAIASDDAAIELYLSCLHKVNFTDQLKKAQDFREWKRKEAEKLADPGLRLALRHQLRWLVLTLQAASPKPDVVKLTSDAQEIVDAIFRDFEKLKGQEQILTESVTSTVFARAYDVNQVKVADWPLSPVDLKAVYDSVLLPPYRNPARLATLRAGWIKRIQQETQVHEYWNGRRQDRSREEKKIGTVESLQSPEYTKFLDEGVPKLQWEMEVDLFKNGDQNGSAVRMLAFLNKHLDHPSSREWGDQFKALLKPQVAAAPATPVVVGDAAP